MIFFLFLSLITREASASYAPTSQIWNQSSGNYVSVTASGAMKVDGSGVTQPVSGTFWQATQPVSGTFWQSTQPVSGTFWQATQPVSGTVAVSNSFALDATLTGGTQKTLLRGTAKGTTVAGDLTSTNVDANTQALDVAVKGTVPVSGTFWQGTQPVSLASAPTTPVTGTFWQATQPVSIASMPSTPVTGTFWQSTQPISAAALPLPASAATDASVTNVQGTVAAGAAAAKSALAGGVFNTSLPSLTTGQQAALQLTTNGKLIVDNSTVTQPVSGTFWQATQPVSGTVTANAGTGTMAVSAASLPLPSGASTDASVTGLQVGQASTTSGQKGSLIQGAVTTAAPSYTTAQTSPLSLTTAGALRTDSSAVTQPVSVAASVTVAQPTAASLNATVVGGTLTKGTQGATGFSIQQLKDAGRNVTNYFMATQIVSTATDALMSLTGYKGGAAVAATTTPAVVTAGKTYRLQSATLSYVTIITTPGAVRFTLRANTGGVVAITSPAVQSWEVGEPTGGAPVAGKWNTVNISIPDGMEFAAGTGIGVSMVGLGATGSAAVVGYGKISLHGYEY